MSGAVVAAASVVGACFEGHNHNRLLDVWRTVQRRVADLRAGIQDTLRGIKTLAERPR